MRTGFEPEDKSQEIPRFTSNPGNISPGVTFARAQAQALATRPLLAPPASSYNNLMTPRAMPENGATVKCTFIPSLPDELEISTGETVRVLSEYDDGWALCVNSRGEQGMVPLECLDRGFSNDQQDGRSTRRVSSLAGRY